MYIHVCVYIAGKHTIVLCVTVTITATCTKKMYIHICTNCLMLMSLHWGVHSSLLFVLTTCFLCQHMLHVYSTACSSWVLYFAYITQSHCPIVSVSGGIVLISVLCRGKVSHLMTKTCTHCSLYTRRLHRYIHVHVCGLHAYMCMCIYVLDYNVLIARIFPISSVFYLERM